MKTINLLICVFLGSMMFAQTNNAIPRVNSNAQGVFEFETETINYGTIEKNSDGYRTFVFTNTGNAPILINRVVGSCGCTVPTKPEEAILPGEKGEIKVKYATNKVGVFKKSVKIYSNASEETKIVYIKGNVVNPDPAAQVNN